MSVKVVKPTTQPRRTVTLFLAGAIDNGNAIDWQSDMADRITNRYGSDTRFDFDVTVYNPRNDNWNPDAGPEELRSQITWELDRLSEVDLVVMVFPEDSAAPISFLELGMLLERKDPKDLIVFCPTKFYRFMNVGVTCGRYGVGVHTESHIFYDAVMERILELGKL